MNLKEKVEIEEKRKEEKLVNLYRFWGSYFGAISVFLSFVLIYPYFLGKSFYGGFSDFTYDSDMILIFVFFLIIGLFVSLSIVFYRIMWRMKKEENQKVDLYKLRQES